VFRQRFTSLCAAGDWRGRAVMAAPRLFHSKLGHQPSKHLPERFPRQCVTPFVAANLDDREHASKGFRVVRSSFQEARNVFRG